MFLYINFGRFGVLNTGFFCTSPLCQIASMATRDTHTTHYAMSSAEVTAGGRKPIETGDSHPIWLWSHNQTRVLGASSYATLALNRVNDPRSQMWVSSQCAIPNLWKVKLLGVYYRQVCLRKGNTISVCVTWPVLAQVTNGFKSGFETTQRHNDGDLRWVVIIMLVL
jgi:hypothetical protein